MAIPPPARSESMMKIENAHLNEANGNKDHSVSEKGAERKICTEFAGGEKLFFECQKGVERKIRVEFPDGQKQFYECEKDVERMVSVEFPNGRNQFYDGEKRGLHEIPQGDRLLPVILTIDEVEDDLETDYNAIVDSVTELKDLTNEELTTIAHHINDRGIKQLVYQFLLKFKDALLPKELRRNATHRWWMRRWDTPNMSIHSKTFARNIRRFFSDRTDL
jgi:hypothetical protein